MKKSRSEFAVLGMLTLRPMSGYDIRKAIQQSIAHIWSESFGQIYPTLRKLVDRGLVQARAGGPQGKRDRQVYALTAKGRAHLAQWLAQPAQSQPVRNELLLKLFFARHMPPEAALQHVRKFRREQEQYLDLYAQIDSRLRTEYSTHADLKFWLIALNYGRRGVEALLKWCDETLAVLEAGTEKKAAATRRKRDQA
jgi:PadR family transcriptional regulator AphA